MLTDTGWQSTRASAALLGGVLIGTAAVLALMGRTPWGLADGPGLWTGAANGPLTSQLLADPYAFIHVSHGLIFFYLFATVLSGASREG